MKQEYPVYIDIDTISKASDPLYTGYFNFKNRIDNLSWKTVSSMFLFIILFLIADINKL